MPKGPSGQKRKADVIGNAVLVMNISALMLSAPAWAQTAPEQPKMYTERPVGDGDPGAISCYPSPSSISRIRKLDCRRNSEWARIYADDKRATEIRGAGKAVEAPVNIMH